MINQGRELGMPNKAKHNLQISLEGPQKEEGFGLEVQVRFGWEGRRGAGQRQIHKKRMDTWPKQRVCAREL